MFLELVSSKKFTNLQKHTKKKEKKKKGKEKKWYYGNLCCWVVGELRHLNNQLDALGLAKFWLLRAENWMNLGIWICRDPGYANFHSLGPLINPMNTVNQLFCSEGPLKKEYKWRSQHQHQMPLQVLRN